MKFSLRTKMIGLLVAVISLMTAALVSIQILHERSVLLVELQKRGISIARSLAYNQATEFGVLTSSSRTLEPLARNALSQDDVSYVIISKSSGHALITVRHPERFPEGNTALPRFDSEQVQATSLTDGTLVYDVVVPVMIERKTPQHRYEERDLFPESSIEEAKAQLVQVGLCQVGMSGARVQQDLLAFGRTIVLTIILISLIVMVILIAAINRLLIQRILLLYESTQKVSEGNLDVHIATRKHRADELSMLGAAYNHMIDSLRRDMDELNQRIREVHRLDRMKSEFLANISHELRTPLNSIIGYSQILQEGIDGSLNDEQIRSVQAILRNGRSLLQLISDILDFSKIEAGRVEVNVGSCMLRRSVEAVLSVVEPLRTHKELNVVVSIPDQFPELLTDEVKLKQILLNLLNNAIKYTPKGEIRVLARKVEEDRVRITVSDTGVGIPEGQIEAIFTEFIQVHTPATAGQEGTGLGLPIARHLAQLLGGRLHAESEMGKGSAFHLDLPVRYEAELSG